MRTRFSTLFAGLFGFVSLLLLSGCGGANLIDRAQSPFGYGICGLIILILNIIAIVEIAGSSRSAGDKLLWILLVLIFPVLGFFAYYLFARR
ncbi:MAG: PLD nuclease N-terminal domain-containing protein [Bacteroidota bacterium]